MDQDRLLTHEELTLSSDIKLGEPRNEFLVIKNVPHRTYLTVTRDQWKVLQRFREGTTVSQLLPDLILDRACPPLRELYELILQAVQSRVLEYEGMEPAPVRAVDWRFSLGYRVAEAASVFLILFGFLAFLRNSVDLPEKVWEILFGWGLMGVALSIGYLLAACLVRGFDCEVYNPRLHWKTLVPHFRVEIEDAAMGGRNCEVGVALLRLAPTLLIAGIVSFLYPPLEYLFLLFLFWQTCPIGKTPATALLSSLYRQVTLSTTRDFLFVQNRLLTTMLNTKLKFADKKYLLVYGFYTLGWTLVVFWSNVGVFDLNAVALFQQLLKSTEARWVATFMLVLLAIALVGSAGLGLWIILQNVHRFLRQLWHQVRPVRHRKSATEVNRADIIDLLRKSILFSEALEATVERLAECVECVEVKARHYVIREGDEGDRLFVVYRGRVEVVHELPSGRPERLAELGDGDVFGEIALLENKPRTRSVRTLSKTVLLTLSKEDFDRNVVRTMGADKIEEILQKRAFLTRLDLCRSWHGQALQRFAQVATISRFPKGEVIIHRGHGNQFFYIVYEGWFDVMVDRNRVARLEIGEYFGEISLMQNSVATADIVAGENAKALAIHKNEFLRFLAQDFHVGLQFEKISSERLKHPIFPLQGKSFDTIDAV